VTGLDTRTVVIAHDTAEMPAALAPQPCPTTPQVRHAHHRPTRPGRWWAPSLAALPLAALLTHGLHHAGPVILVLLSTVTP
jgi:hypothetical protein